MRDSLKESKEICILETLSYCSDAVFKMHELWSFMNSEIRLSAWVVYRSHRSGLSSDIRSGQANFYSAESGAG